MDVGPVAANKSANNRAADVQACYGMVCRAVVQEVRERNMSRVDQVALRLGQKVDDPLVQSSSPGG